MSGSIYLLDGNSMYFRQLSFPKEKVYQRHRKRK
jgi:hypothetical protein